MSYSRDIIIAAPMETVFRLIEEPEQRKLWMPRLVDTVFNGRAGTEQPERARFTSIFLVCSLLLECQGEISGYANPELFSMIVGGRNFALGLAYELEDAEGGTHLKHSARFIPRSAAGRAAGLLFGWLGKKHLNRQLRLLKAQAEGEASIRG